MSTVAFVGTPTTLTSANILAGFVDVTTGVLSQALYLFDVKIKDATTLLKSEIVESQQRVKAAKHGHRLEDIAPPYSDAFYLPDKT